MLEQTTPVILTLNEQENIGRCLSRLEWARDVVIVDSGSKDRTVDIAGAFPNTRIIQRRFDEHATQWNYAIEQAESQWVLALDADYMVPPELVDEMDRLDSDAAIDGYEARFVYCCKGRGLRGSLYPPKVVLFRNGAGIYRQDGHTQRLNLSGTAARLRGRILHDDRKPTDRWLANQWGYAVLEAESLTSDRSQSALSVLRRMRLTPLIVPLYLLFFRGLILDGSAGVRYATERMIAECLIAVALGERPDGRNKKDPRSFG